MFTNSQMQIRKFIKMKIKILQRFALCKDKAYELLHKLFAR